MSASLGLYRLQLIDRQLDRALSQMEDIRRKLEDDAELRTALERVDRAQNDFDLAERTMRSAEVEAQTQQLKISRAESSLYGGQVHNPKELQDLQNDVVSLKRHLSSLEERELESMVAVEDLDRGLASARADLEKLQANLGVQHKDLLDKNGRLMKELDKLREERQATIKAMEPTHLSGYEALRKTKKGLAVAEVTDNACSACGSTLNAAIQQSARSNTHLVHCPTCNRILYAA